MHHFFTQSIDFKSFSTRPIYIADKNFKPTKHSLLSSNLFKSTKKNDRFHNQRAKHCASCKINI